MTEMEENMTSLELKTNLESKLYDIQKHIDSAASIGLSLIQIYNEISGRLKEISCIEFEKNLNSEKIDLDLQNKIDKLYKKFKSLKRLSKESIDSSNLCLSKSNSTENALISYGAKNCSNSYSLNVRTNKVNKRITATCYSSGNPKDIILLIETAEGLLKETGKLREELNCKLSAFNELENKNLSLKENVSNLESQLSFCNCQLDALKEEQWELLYNLQETTKEKNDLQTLLQKTKNDFIKNHNDTSASYLETIEQLNIEKNELNEKVQELDALRSCELKNFEDQNQQFSESILNFKNELDSNRKLACSFIESIYAEDYFKDSLETNQSRSTPISPPVTPVKLNTLTNSSKDSVKCALELAQLVISHLNDKLKNQSSEEASLKQQSTQYESTLTQDSNIKKKKRLSVDNLQRRSRRRSRFINSEQKICVNKQHYSIYKEESDSSTFSDISNVKHNETTSTHLEYSQTIDHEYRNRCTDDEEVFLLSNALYNRGVRYHSSEDSEDNISFPNMVPIEVSKDNLDYLKNGNPILPPLSKENIDKFLKENYLETISVSELNDLRNYSKITKEQLEKLASNFNMILLENDYFNSLIKMTSDELIKENITSYGVLIGGNIFKREDDNTSVTSIMSQVNSSDAVQEGIVFFTQTAKDQNSSESSHNTLNILSKVFNFTRSDYKLTASIIESSNLLFKEYHVPLVEENKILPVEKDEVSSAAMKCNELQPYFSVNNKLTSLKQDKSFENFSVSIEKITVSLFDKFFSKYSYIISEAKYVEIIQSLLQQSKVASIKNMKQRYNKSKTVLRAISIKIYSDKQQTNCIERIIVFLSGDRYENFKEKVYELSLFTIESILMFASKVGLVNIFVPDYDYLDSIIKADLEKNFKQNFKQIAMDLGFQCMKQDEYNKLKNFKPSVEEYKAYGRSLKLIAIPHKEYRRLKYFEGKFATIDLNSSINDSEAKPLIASVDDESFSVENYAPFIDLVSVPNNNLENILFSIDKNLDDIKPKHFYFSSSDFSELCKNPDEYELSKFISMTQESFNCLFGALQKKMCLLEDSLTVGSNTSANSNSDTNSDSNANSDHNITLDSNANSDSNLVLDANANSDYNITLDSDENANSDSNTVSDANANSDSNTSLDSNINSNSDSDSSESLNSNANLNLNSSLETQSSSELDASFISKLSSDLNSRASLDLKLNFNLKLEENSKVIPSKSEVPVSDNAKQTLKLSNGSPLRKIRSLTQMEVKPESSKDGNEIHKGETQKSGKVVKFANDLTSDTSPSESELSFKSMMNDNLESNMDNKNLNLNIDELEKGIVGNKEKKLKDDMKENSKVEMDQMISHTISGAYLWKYVRNYSRTRFSSNKHMRYFWIDPITMTLSWSNSIPEDKNKSNYKRYKILNISVKHESSLNPPVVYPKSMLIELEGKTIKVSCPTQKMFNLWYDVISHLLGEKKKVVKRV